MVGVFYLKQGTKEPGFPKKNDVVPSFPAMIEIRVCSDGGA
jgi:hypothetical protein